VLVLSLSRSDILLPHAQNLFRVDDFSKQTKKEKNEKKEKKRKEKKKKRKEKKRKEKKEKKKINYNITVALLRCWLRSLMPWNTHCDAVTNRL